MEGAAFHYIGIMKSIPFIQIRGISNFVGERNKKNWKIDEAILAYTKAYNSLLQQL
jgi:futalosine hydrolase